MSCMMFDVFYMRVLMILICKTIQSYKTPNFYHRGVLLLLVLVITYIFSAVFGMNEAIQTYKKTKDDNFYLDKKKFLKKENCDNTLIGQIFLFIYKTAYNSYRKLFPNKINKENLSIIENRLLKLKEFGPGNYNLFMMFIMYQFSH